jgi:formate dehydrogenase major subunit
MLVMMLEGQIRGLFCMGQNPAVGGQNALLARAGLRNLDWLVVRDLFEIETAAYWHDAPEVRNGEVRPSDIKTEVFLLPASVTAEKSGSYTNTQRLIQWHDQAVEPPGDARSEGWFVDGLYRRLLRLYEGDDGPGARQIRAIRWNYPTLGELGEPDLEHVLAEITGRHVADGAHIHDFDELAADGSTECGCWIYAGVMPEPGVNLAKNRNGDEHAALGWGYAWPGNTRTLYNRASADPSGSPWSQRKAWIWWDSEAQRWTGQDRPNFPTHKPPGSLPLPDGRGLDAHDGHSPFLMTPDGKGQLFTFAGLKDGPLPTHYEPWETPVGNPLYPNVPRNPAARLIHAPGNPYHEIGDRRFPHVITTYRLTEHHTAGAMTRFLPWLSELQPAGFAEIDPALAAEVGIVNGDWVVVTTLRGEIEARALVTDRLAPLQLGSRRVHQVGVPWHFGYSGIAVGGIANDLSSLVEDPNSLIHEGKSFTCAVRAGRLAAGSAPS